jgi:hypothetical protein
MEVHGGLRSISPNSSGRSSPAPRIDQRRTAEDGMCVALHLPHENPTDHHKNYSEPIKDCADTLPTLNALSRHGTLHLKNGLITSPSLAGC